MFYYMFYTDFKSDRRQTFSFIVSGLPSSLLFFEFHRSFVHLDIMVLGQVFL
jgi:hypothetical protein